MQKIIVANWKMYGSRALTATFLTEFLQNNTNDYTYIFCPPFPFLSLFQSIKKTPNLQIGAQNCAAYENGPFTGEISAEMLKDMECSFCLVGHSERRHIFKEDDNDILRAKIDRLLKQSITPIFCIGEAESDYSAGNTKKVLHHQLQVIDGLKDEILIAYEPLWAIGTNKIPTIGEIEDAHLYIKSFFKCPQKVLYGGSVNPDNASNILSSAAIDGILVGRASLAAKSLLSLKQA
jgi:triosephosphate isomerase